MLCVGVVFDVIFIGFKHTPACVLLEAKQKNRAWYLDLPFQSYPQFELLKADYHEKMELEYMGRYRSADLSKKLVCRAKKTHEAVQTILDICEKSL